MNADLYAAWRTAGDNLHHVGVWAAGHWTGLAALGVAVGVLTVLGWAFRRDDYRTRNDKRQALQLVHLDRPEPGEPGVDAGLYLDCVAIYGDCDELDRLREAINQHRKETP